MPRAHSFKYVVKSKLIVTAFQSNNGMLQEAPEKTNINSWWSLRVQATVKWYIKGEISCSNNCLSVCPLTLYDIRMWHIHILLTMWLITFSSEIHTIFCHSPVMHCSLQIHFFWLILCTAHHITRMDDGKHLACWRGGTEKYCLNSDFKKALNLEWDCVSS